MKKTASSLTLCFFISIFLLFFSECFGQSITNETHLKPIRIGSKQFAESYLLGEIMAQLLETHHYPVERVFGLGGTLLCYQALLNAEIDIYPEYTGTLEQAILKQPGIDYNKINLILSTDNLELLSPFGFNNTYALTLKRSRAEKLSISNISQLKKYPSLKLFFSHEFINREDGWKKLSTFYYLPHRPVGIEHALSYRALDKGKIDVTDVYTTDGEIIRFDLTLLNDDKHFFPTYYGAPLVRKELGEEVLAILSQLSNVLTDQMMQDLNAQVVLDKQPVSKVAQIFLAKHLKAARGEKNFSDSYWQNLTRRIVEHLKLTLIAVLFGLLISIPLGIIAYKVKYISRPIVYIAGLLQTIPAIALLCIMIPVFGTGVKPALIALFLYSLLPILRNTVVALNAIDPTLKRVAIGIGLTSWQRLIYVELPLAGPTIFSGIKTATIITIGTATLAGYIGAGGLGEAIFTGVALSDFQSIIWDGAIPAMALAVVIEWILEGIEFFIIPKHLKNRLG